MRQTSTTPLYGTLEKLTAVGADETVDIAQHLIATDLKVLPRP